MKPLESLGLLFLCLLLAFGISVASQLSSDALAILATLLIIAPWSLLALAIVVAGTNRRNQKTSQHPQDSYTNPTRELPRQTHQRALPAPQGRHRVIIEEPEPDYVVVRKSRSDQYGEYV
jgi:hypothetical protein